MQMRNIWGSQGDKLVVSCNRFDQPTGENTSKLANFIGTLVRNEKNTPLHYKSRETCLTNTKMGFEKPFKHDTSVTLIVHIQLEFILGIALIIFR